ncbi:MAG TPA: acetylxylan esterase [Pirellulales bacterium]|nr:acetylxylan esterase [Pirellulales bacterium]
MNRCTPRRPSATALFVVLFSAAAPALIYSGFAKAEVPRALPAGKLPADKRLDPPKDLDGYFPLEVPTTAEKWQQRAERVRRQVKVATGLWPLPSVTPVNAVVHGRIDRNEYTVDRVFLESWPGHFVTGSLYRPKGRSGKLPAVLCPHGHWTNGRFVDQGLAMARQQIVDGAERFVSGGRFPLQARCVQLARMGCVVFHYDMVGYADSQQIPSQVSHGYGKIRPSMESADNWGFFSAQAELRLQSIMGLQTFNSVRALDWITSLPEVDPTRIGVTGASGGGTQTFMLCAVDPRPAAAFPAVMVSTAMQGGCTCENCCLLRVDTGNIELAGLFAPKPLGMTGADDWTKEIATKGLPELKQLYKLLGAEANVMAKPLVQFPHNYNFVSRGVMYSWFNKHLQLGYTDPIVEEDFVPLTVAEMTVWDDTHPKPPAGEDYERSLVKQITADADRQLAALVPSDAASLSKYRQVVGGAVEAILGHSVADIGAPEFEKSSEEDRGDYLEFAGLLRNPLHGQELPVAFLLPKKWNKRVVLWIDESGKAGLYGNDGGPKPEVKKLLAAGTSVAGIDLFGQGEFLAQGQAPIKNRRVKNPREFAGFTYGYNHPLFAQRVHDILALVSFARTSDQKPERVDLLGLNGAGPWVAAAAAVAGEAIDRLAVDTAGFRFARLTAFDDAAFLPGIVKYGDVPALLALSAPRPLWLAGESAETPAVVRKNYAAAGQAGNLSEYKGDEGGEAGAAVEWLLK